MKRLILLLVLVLAVGAISFWLLQNRGDLQVQLSKSLTTDKEDTTAPEEEPVIEYSEGLTINFSKGKSFYDEDISVELTCNDPDAVIYYTIDGNDPDEASKKYSEPIKLRAKNDVAATTIKAIAVRDNEKTDIVHKSYVLGTDVFDRFDDSTLIFVLSTDEYNLYDYYYGVATEGYKRDEYLNSDEYDGGEIDYNAPANWHISGRESERDMYVEVFTNDGEQIISQAAGGRVVGGVSRANTQKSWRLIARNMYSENNGKFKYPFFKGNTDSVGNLTTRYDRITLRDNANDREFASIRDELSMTLSSEAGFPDVQSVRPAAVFLNSQYYGFSWLHEAYSNDYLANNYGGNKENFRIIGAKEQEMEGDDEKSVADWNHVLDLAYKGLDSDLRFNEFCNLVDIDNLMLYYAIQIYIDNKDWPGNNFKAWRYYPDENEIVNSEYLDGRWRFLLFDAEFAWGLYGNGFKTDTLTAVLTGNHMQGDSVLLKALLKRDDMKEKFANTICDLIGGAFSTENAVNTVEKLIEDCDKECIYALNNGYTSTWANEHTFADSRQQIRDFAEKRPDVMKKYVAKSFGYSGDTYTVELYNPEGSIAVLGSQTASTIKKLSAQYFSECSVNAGVSTFDGYSFNHWEINGITYNTEDIRINKDMANDDGVVIVRLYVDKLGDEKGVIVSELYTAGKGDWVELYNDSSTDADISGYYLSDDKNDMKKWKIKEGRIPANETLIIVMKDNNEESALKRQQTNFKLKTGETLYLSDKEGNVISSVPVVVMNDDESVTIGYDGRYRIGTVTENYHIE